MLKTLSFFPLGDPVLFFFSFFSLFRSITELLHRKFAMGRRYHHARKSLQYPTTLGRLPSQPNDIYVQVLFHCTTCLLVTHIPRTLLSKGKWSPYCVHCLSENTFQSILNNHLLLLKLLSTQVGTLDLWKRALWFFRRIHFKRLKKGWELVDFFVNTEVRLD